MKIQRVENLTKEIFIEEFLLPNKPVIITDAMKEWRGEKFIPDYLEQEFGHYEVQIYNDLFDLQTIDTLGAYLNQNFNNQLEAKGSIEYIRWYTKLKEVDFFWSDEVFASLKEAWSNPYFFPNDSLAIPFTKKGEFSNINDTRFPYKGLFISGKGARTRLHRDPFNSDAILCQFFGEKKIVLYHPNQAEYIMNGNEFVDIKNPDSQKFPNLHKTNSKYEDILSPGEIIIFPAGWFHDVTCLSDSISITWNFVHSSKLDDFYSYIKKNPDDDQLEIVRFFLKGLVRENADVNEITDFFKKEF